MKRVHVAIVLTVDYLWKRLWFCLVTVVCVLALFLSGCGYSGYISQPGETAAEGHRRHLRNLSISQQAMMGDIDRAFLADKPSKMTPTKIE